MAAAVGDSRGSAGKKLKKSLKRKKKMKTAARAVASELEDGDADAADAGGRCGPDKGPLSSEDEAAEADNEEEVEPCDGDSEHAAGARAGSSAGWADAMAKILSRKLPRSKPTILLKNKELEKEKEKLKQERLEKRKQVCPPAVL